MAEQYNIHWKDYYEILQLHPSAEPEVIKAAYLKLVQKYNNNQNSSMSDQKWKDLNEAYEYLSDADKRKKYDQYYKTRATSAATPTSRPTPPPRPPPPPTTTRPVKPKPVVRPSIIKVDGAIPGKRNRATFVIDNIGGPFSKILLPTILPNWMTIVPLGSKLNSSRVPFEVALSLTSEEWGMSYSARLIVKLDNEEAFVQVELKMAPKPTKPVSPDPTSGSETSTAQKQGSDDVKKAKSQKPTQVDYSYVPQRDVEGQINLFAQTRCSYCSNYADTLILCPPRKVVSNCINFKSMSGDWHNSKLKETRYWPWISELLKPYIKGRGLMARCTDVNCLALNPAPRDVTAKCWKCGGNTLICPKHLETGKAPILKYDLSNLEWKCPDDSCGYHISLPKEMRGYELIGLKYPKTLDDLKSKYAKDTPKTPPKPTDHKPQNKRHWWE